MSVCVPLNSHFSSCAKARFAGSIGISLKDGPARSCCWSSTRAKSNFGFSNLGIANCQVAMGKPDTAVRIFRESIATFEEMSPTSASNRYPRSGLAQAYAGLAGAYAGLASNKNLPRSQTRGYWQEAHSACQKSLSVWNDKERRGELESGEREALREVAQCVANTDAQLRVLAPKPASLH